MSQQKRVTADGFLFSHFSGDEEVYFSFPETGAGDSGAVLIPIETLKRLMREVGILDD